MQQKALSLMQFQKKFGTEKACQKHLFRLRWPDGFAVPATNGTVFYKTRTPLTKWFWMVWLMERQKSGISTLSL